MPIRIAVTLPLFEEFARAMGGENVEVISLVPPGADPHTYQFTGGDIERMSGIDFFFVNGLGLDSHLQDVIEANRDDDAYVIPFAPNIRSPQRRDLTAEQAGDNAHLWLDPTLAYVYPEIVADELIIYDGIRQDFYSRNFTAYRERMLALQEELTAKLAAIPPERRKLITLHDSFPHFAERFGLTVAGFATTSPGVPVAQADIQRLVDVVRAEGIPAVFAEHGYASAPMEQIAGEAGVVVCDLYSDVLNGSVSSYEELMRANADEIVRCLG